MAYRNRQRIIFIGPKGKAVLSSLPAPAADAYCFSPEDTDLGLMEEQSLLWRQTLLAAQRVIVVDHRQTTSARGGTPRENGPPPRRTAADRGPSSWLRSSSAPPGRFRESALDI